MDKKAEEETKKKEEEKKNPVDAGPKQFVEKTKQELAKMTMAEQLQYQRQ